jgi:hypothetical protein
MDSRQSPKTSSLKRVGHRVPLHAGNTGSDRRPELDVGVLQRPRVGAARQQRAHDFSQDAPATGN